MSNVIIIGGGAAGMMAAITAARNNNKVTLIEKNEKLECLWSNDNKLTKLRLTNNKQLVSLECTWNQ